MSVPKSVDESVLHQELGQVFYCIGLTADFRSRPFDTVRAHVTLLSKVLEYANFESLVYLSSTRVYARSSTTLEVDPIPIDVQDSSDLYNISKLLGESLCISSGRQSVKVARLSNVVGEGMGTNSFLGQIIEAARSGSVRLGTHPDSSKDYVCVDDVVRLLGLIAKRGRERIYNVASGVQVSHRQWLSAVSAATGCEIDVDTRTPYQSFPAIDIQRIRDEFGFFARDALIAFPEFAKLS